VTSKTSPGRLVERTARSMGGGGDKKSAVAKRLVSKDTDRSAKHKPGGDKTSDASKRLLSTDNKRSAKHKPGDRGLASDRAFSAVAARPLLEKEAKGRQSEAGQDGIMGGRGKIKPLASVDTKGLPKRSPGDRGRASRQAGELMGVSSITVDASKAMKFKRLPHPRRPRRGKTTPKLAIPLWARLPDDFGMIERGERLEPIPERGPRLLIVTINADTASTIGSERK